MASKFLTKTIYLNTEGAYHFIDLTKDIKKFVKETKAKNGLVNIQILHTSAALSLNECDEPLLCKDLKNHLERFAPQSSDYHHDNFGIRTVNMNKDEGVNGHAHCKASILPATITLNLINSELQIGTYQKIFFIELDCPRKRRVQIAVLGV